MNQQVSVEDALIVFRRKCSELTDANALLEARAVGLERQVSQLETANAELMKSLEASATGAGLPSSVTSEC
jgi:CII-binding regulator of phage lambda lysogenization HflD